ncbi:pyridoxamine 5'-phosphate oxidase family protein [Streptomyces minutiscleroticus]|uniref:Pyridoxamine 5'-phosphate oxidase n=1 Tax=Streptomyces minutiscleroticus TaxID=68238 RepID=A0A918KF06_9ACTN|nr:pyridoxamine 5'-phosphate oxidase family protein [Streptomyces minutiscleroticus]GGX59275.1 pyridoxamine 5'-phosphate oxidase [Streptomyces minutiscleroticus]
MALTREEREQFLAEPHVGALAVAAEEGRAPLSVPIWYHYEPGGELWILTGRDSRKARLIGDAGRFTMMADRVEPTIRYVCAEGPVVGVAPGTREDHLRLASRYLPAGKAEAFVDYAERELGPQVVIRMRPQHWVGSDLGRM